MAGQYGKPSKTGKSKRTLAQRRKDNAGVKEGTVRAGKAGKQMRQYNKKTGRWELIKSPYGAPRMAGKPTTKPLSSGASGAAKAGTSSSSAAVKVAPAGRGASNAARGGSVTKKGASYAKQTLQSPERASNMEVAATLLAAGSTALLGGAGIGALAGRGAMAARAAAVAAPKAIGAAGRVAKSTRPKPPSTTVSWGTPVRNGSQAATQRAVASGQVPKAALSKGAPKAIEGPVKPPAGVSKAGGPATAKGNPRTVNRPARPTAAQKKNLATYEANRPAKLPPGARRATPVGNPKLNGAKNTGPKTKAQAMAAARQAAAKKAAATRAANKLSRMKP